MERNSDLKISVVIPMYNASKTIERALNSIKEQTFKCNYQIIVVNDGSKDNSQEIVEKYISDHPELNIILINQINGGVSKARNTGLRKANGDFIALLDSDDIWMSNKIERQVNEIQNLDGKIDFIRCARNNEKLYLKGKYINSTYKVSPKDLLIKMFPQTSTALFKRSLYIERGGYNESMTHAEDGELWVRFCKDSEFYYMPESLVITGDGKPSFGHSGLSANLLKMYEGNIKILNIAKNQKIISNSQYLFFRIFYKIKHYRRIILTKIR